MGNLDKHLRLLRLRARAPIPCTRKRRASSARPWRKPASRLVYGGGSVGLMGTLARAVLDAGGAVTGIIPGFLQEPRAADRRT